MLTPVEIAITVIALMGVGYNAMLFLERRSERGWTELRIALYALLVVMPQLLVILYAFQQFAVD